MQDAPEPGAMLAAVAAFLRDQVVPAAEPHLAFQARVAASALDLVQRQIALSGGSDAAAHARLRDLLGQEGALAALNAILAARIATGALDPFSAGVAAHLRATTLEKLAVDQPAYSGYRAALAGEK